MKIADFLAETKRRLLWLGGLMAAFLILAIFQYSRLQDKFSAFAVTAAKTSEERSFDPSALSGLAALAGGGQRPAFEQMAYLVQSSPVIEGALPALKKDNPQMVDSFVRYSSMRQLFLDIEQSARASFGKPPIRVDLNQRMVDAVRGSLKVSKTPEGYVKVSFSNRLAGGQTELLRNLLEQADLIIRTRERGEHVARMNIYRGLLVNQNETTARTVLVSLINREFSNYVNSEAGSLFSFKYVEPLSAPTRHYSISLFTLVVAALVSSWFTFGVLVSFLVWRDRN